MSAEKLLISFDRPLPPPFDTLTTGKLVKGVASMYAGGAADATLTATVCKAVLAYCGCKSGNGQGAVGLCDTKTVAEYKSSESPDLYHLVVYDPGSGSVMAAVYNKNTEMVETYTVGKAKRDGSAVMLAMMPTLLGDKEFEDAFNGLYEEYKHAFPDTLKAVNFMGLLCDNVYRRIKDTKCPAHVKAKVDPPGNLTRISATHLMADKFKPNTLFAGEFEIFKQSSAPTVYTPAAAPDNNAFSGQYKLNPARTLMPLEQQLVPVLTESYILPSEIVNICLHAQKTTGKQTQMRNFLLRGPAGTGKTAGAKAIAAGLGLPYMKYTCSANSEIYDFVGQVFPETDSVSTGDAVLDQERDMLKKMGGITYGNVAKLMKLPDLDDMDYDPAGVYRALAGVEKADAKTQDCVALVLNMVSDKIQALSRVSSEAQTTGQTYTYVETDFIKALKHGYVVEIQEPSTIMQPGVLVGLNSLLEQEGSITLPTGEIINRHPDAVVVVTTNIDYEGCRGMNQSVLDRMSLVADIELPAPEIMVQRAMGVTGADDEYQVSQMVNVVNDMSDYCRKNGITDGSVGMRGLMDWIVSAEITGDPYTSALDTIISKATSSEEDRSALIASVLEPIFAPKKRKKS